MVSVTGVTGARTVLENRVESLVKQLKQYVSSPIAVGFGISTPDHIRQVRSWGADGAIVGSALVKVITESDPDSAVDNAVAFCMELRKAIE